MHILSIRPVADIVLKEAAPISPYLNIDSALPSQYWKNINLYDEWKKLPRGKRPDWTTYATSFANDEHRVKAIQDQKAARKPQNPVAEAPDPVAPDPVAEASDPGGPMGEQGEFNFMESPQQFLQRIRDGVNQFGKQFNIKTIRPYNNAIQHALRAVKSLSQQPDISPDIRDRGEQLLQLFQQIQAGDAEDAKLVQQLGQLAYQLGQSAGAYQPGSGAASNMQTRGPEPQPQPQPAPQQPGFGQKIRDGVGQAANWMGRQFGKLPSPAQVGLAESDGKVLTASMGSAQSLIEEFYTQSQ